MKDKAKLQEPDIDLDQFIEINSDELNCIFAEQGLTCEQDFDYDKEAEALLYSKQFPHLIRKIKDK